VGISCFDESYLFKEVSKTCGLLAVCRCFKNHCRAEFAKYEDKQTDYAIQNPKPQYEVRWGNLKGRDLSPDRIKLKWALKNLYIWELDLTDLALDKETWRAVVTK
jgi:hypothetical protein